MATSLSTIDTQQIESGLALLRKDAAALKVVDKQTNIEAGQIENACKAYIKDVKAKMQPGIDSAKNHLDFLKNEMAKFVAPAQEIQDAINKKRLDYNAEEKRQKQIEQDRENARLAEENRIKAENDRRESERIAAEERKAREKEIEKQRAAGELKAREAAKLKKEAEEAEQRERERAAKVAEETKAAPPRVEVKANIPTIAGLKNQTYYYGDVLQPALIIAEFAMTTDQERRLFLQRFIRVDEQEVGKFARETKDNAKATAALPGVKFWSKG